MRATKFSLLPAQQNDVLANTPNRPGWRKISGGIFRLIGRWREHERLRRDLSSMRAGDFGDLSVPPGLIAEEVRKWAWQKDNPLWGEIRSTTGKVFDAQ